MGCANYNLALDWLTEIPWDMELPADQPWLMVCAVAGRAPVWPCMVRWCWGGRKNIPRPKKRDR